MMALEPGKPVQSVIVGGLRLPGPGEAPPPGNAPDPQAPVAMLIELNARYPGGLAAATTAFYGLWGDYAAQAGGSWSADPRALAGAGRAVPRGLAFIAQGLYQCVLSRATAQDLVTQDRRTARDAGRSATVFRVWPDYQLYPHIDRSAATVKADAGWRAFDACGRGIVWAVIDSGIDASHEHFSALELHAEAGGAPVPDGATSGLHRDFSYLVNPDDPDDPAGGAADEPASTASPSGNAGSSGNTVIAGLTDEFGHGTHVSGIIAGRCPPGRKPRVAVEQDPDGGYVPRAHVGTLSGMAPECELVSLKVTRRSRWGRWVTSSSAVIRALTYLRTEVNEDPDVLRVHGVNMSLGCGWDPSHYAAGQSPLCRAVNQLVASGVVVVISAGNSGANLLSGDAAGEAAPGAVMGSISEPAHAADCIAVGSTHRDAPHTFGITWTSAKGPTLDGRTKPDIVAPGEWITSAATGELRAGSGFDPAPANAAPANPGAADTSADSLLTYAEQSGTSMSAPHVSGVIAAFLSARPEFVGKPQQVKDLLLSSAQDLGRDRNAQGAGLADLMRMLSHA
jgi:subtilisin family serine protease